MVRRLLRWAGYGIVGLLVLLTAALVVIFVRSERVLARTYEAERWDPPPAAAAPDLAEGARLARTRGCLGGCHGERLEGRVFYDEPWIARITAGNLPRLARRYSDADFERAIRRGIRADGTGLFGMPSDMLYHLRDEDLRAIIAFIRSLPVEDGLDSRLEPRLLGRVGLVAGMYEPAVVAAESAAVRDAAAPRDTSLGRYVAMSACSECHGVRLEGSPESGTPALSIVRGYSAAAFDRLLRTGEPADGRELGLMARVARSRFAHFTDEEITALYHYLATR